MAFLEIEDFDGTIELLAFGDSYEKYRHLLALDAMVLVKGAILKDDERQPKIRVEKVMALSETRDLLTRSVHVRLRTQGLEEEFIREVYDECRQCSGNCSLVIHLVTQEQNEFRLRPRQLKLAAQREVVDRLRMKLGRDNVWLGRTAA